MHSDDGESVVELPVAAILPNPRQPRRQFSPERIGRLADSIATQGVIQPLLVRPHPALEGRYQLIAGERRLRAIRHLGWPQAPALVRALPDQALLETALVENLQRDQLTPIEEAQAYRDLMEHHGYTQEALARRVGRDRSTIANMMRLLALPPGIQADLEAERLTVGHARALLAVPDPARREALRERIVTAGLSVREAEKLAAREKPGPGAAKPPALQNPGAPPRVAPEAPGDAAKWEAVRDALESRLGTRVAIHREPGPGGRIELDFYSTDDLNRLFDLLMGK